MIIRLEKENEHREVQNLIRDSFWNVYRPGCSEHYIAHVLRNDPDFVSELNLVLEKEDRIIGQVMFMKNILHTNHGHLPILTMGPICIHPDYKRQGFGQYLLDHALSKAKELGYGAVFIEGNIDFYKHCGFEHASQYHIQYEDMPDSEETPFFLCCILKEGYLDHLSGIYRVPHAYYVQEEDVEKFDESFPYKRKLKLPGQLF